ncbi:MAG: hypothetical protein OEZ48_00795 [Candidatus Bathyarchaeota archaeon]|nr:hypothetical protein [Candidatus Bathyarchaeota archaeon]
MRSFVIMLVILLMAATFIYIVSMAFRWIFWIGVGTILGIAVGYYLWGRRQ